jgi:hypothetical protein
MTKGKAMKKIMLSVIVLLISSTLFAQHSLEKLWQTDTVTLKNPESVLFDPVSHSLYVSSMSAGAIVHYSLDGKLLDKNWVNGLTANKGSAIFNGFFYTAENTTVAVVDMQTRTIVKHIPLPGAKKLNDLAVDSKGVIYVSDSPGAKLFRIEGDSVSLYLENMPGANGLLCIGTDLYVLTSTRVDKVSNTKQITKIADGFESGLDGIVMIAENEFIISNYKGILYDLKTDGTNYIIMDTRATHTNSNDIGFDDKAKILYVPSFGTNCFFAYKLK